MTSLKLYSAKLLRNTRAMVASGVLAVIAVYSAYLLGQYVSLGSRASVHASISSHVIPSLLSEKDAATYQEIFRAQKAADWVKADAGISELSNDMLLGTVLADRYLHRHYNTTADELVLWLKNYSDHPQASDIYELAIHKKPELRNSLPAIGRQAKLGGYGDGDSSVTRFDDDLKAKKIWQDGLSSWRTNHKADAAKYFASLANRDGLTDWQVSAASFWAYRAYLATGEESKANDYLKKAAENPRNFYGVLARKQLNKPLGLDREEVALSEQESDMAMENAGVRRVVALAQAGLTDRAEAQMRALFPQGTDDEKMILLKIASALDLSSVQISMAKQLETSSRQLDFAKYPVPSWEPKDGFSVDPALLYALMRQESGFRASAIGPGGSLGLMQLMPQTASMMQRSTIKSESASEPVMNITLGERYVAHLLSNDAVDGNLFYMLAAYNAGPAKLQNWREDIGHSDDPLLFVESIPYPLTRYYVMQVMTNYWIYSELAGKPSHSVYAVLHNNWPIYRVADMPLANAN